MAYVMSSKFERTYQAIKGGPSRLMANAMLDLTRPDCVFGPYRKCLLLLI